MREIYIPIYGKTLIYVNNQKDYQKACEDYDLDGYGDDVRGATHFDNDQTFVVVVFDNSLNTLIHELGHVCVMLFEHIGFAIESGKEEPFCYLIGWIAEQLQDEFIKQPEKQNKNKKRDKNVHTSNSKRQHILRKT